MSAHDRQYWDGRLAEKFSLEGVGYIGLGTGFNSWMYRVRRRLFLRAAKTYMPGLRSASVLDVGSGTGFYVDCWRQAGASRIVGADIAPGAVARLRESHPQHTFVELDIGGPPEDLPDRRFDAVSAMDILFHITDDERYERAFSNLSALLAPDGVLLLTENFPRGREARALHQVGRALEQFQSAAAAAGLRVVERRPMFVLMNAPFGATGRAATLWWRGLTAVLRRSTRLGAAIGAALYPLELALLRVSRRPLSTELVVCRKAAGAR